jgi:hypothetical protein
MIIILLLDTNYLTLKSAYVEKSVVKDFRLSFLIAMERVK